MKAINYRSVVDRQFLEVIATGKHIEKGDQPVPPARFIRDFKIKTDSVTGNNVFTMSSGLHQNKKVILFLHGGGYLHSMVKQHWNFLYPFIKKYGYTVVVPDYPLAPQYGYQEVFGQVELIYRNLAEQHGAKNMILMGDSAGGGLALALAQKLRDNQSILPEHIIMLSPWLDVSMTNPEIPEIQKRDPFIHARGLKAAGECYATGVSTQNPMVSPIYGDLKNLGKMSLFTGTCDILSADAKKMKRLCDEQAIPINYFEYPDMIHDWMLFGFSESRRVIKEVAEIIGQ